MVWSSCLLGYALVTCHHPDDVSRVTLYRTVISPNADSILHPALAHLFRFLAVVQLRAITKEWSRSTPPHAHADQPGDPTVRGVWIARVLFEGI